jgi:hypothetical protein
MEVNLPGGAAFTHKDGHVRHEIRTRWWDPSLTTYRAAYIGPDGVPPGYPQGPADSGLRSPNRWDAASRLSPPGKDMRPAPRRGRQRRSAFPSSCLRRR